VALDRDGRGTDESGALSARPINKWNETQASACVPIELRFIPAG